MFKMVKKYIILLKNLTLAKRDQMWVLNFLRNPGGGGGEFTIDIWQCMLIVNRESWGGGGRDSQWILWECAWIVNCESWILGGGEDSHWTLWGCCELWIFPQTVFTIPTVLENAYVSRDPNFRAKYGCATSAANKWSWCDIWYVTQNKYKKRDLKQCNSEQRRTKPPANIHKILQIFMILLSLIPLFMSAPLFWLDADYHLF